MEAQIQAYEGYFENGKFYTAGQVIHLPERQRVYITVLDEPVIVNEIDEDDYDYSLYFSKEELNGLERYYEQKGEKLVIGK